jgi:hypothetical protein
MDYIAVLRDSVETSLSLGLFKTKKESSVAHIFNSKLVKLPLSRFNNVENFNPDRLQDSATKAYPLDNRPRGIDDINSVKFYQKQIKNGKIVQPIWLVEKNKKYILLDGAHRIVSTYIENKNTIDAYIISI